MTRAPGAVYFGTLARFEHRWYASVRTRVEGGVSVIDGKLFEFETDARLWLARQVESRNFDKPFNPDSTPKD